MKAGNIKIKAQVNDLGLLVHTIKVLLLQLEDL